MKLYLGALVVIFAVVLCVSSESISEDEVAELISDYNHLYKNYEGEKNAPIREMAQKTKDLTLKYFKTVGIEIAKHMCNSLDNIVASINKIDD
ncbi:unnamed protein product [Chironomus riparius]|uniref:Uncharacterized protein n=1 Tax=Chironomus riparius TaxID=315576 RepID=A0A9N9WU28_9DIPT|nr:unnamed protein product [Chironomus riparius]